MAKITIEELSGGLKEYLNGLGLTEAQVQELIDNFEDEKIGDISQLSTEEKGSLVGAINELFQSANNGKELIANVIGEPVSAEDTFSAMSTDINGLLSTFKTNMMNNGITVESSDKFKQLIDKIATMVEEGSGKGVKFAEGTFNITIKNSYTYDIVINTNLDFTPTLLFLTCGPNVICSNIHNSQNNMVYFGGNTSSVYIYSFDSSSIILRGMTYSDVTTVSRSGTWYAIGVGEEDTTLRDSLADILENKGIDVTEEDDMASLITKVDESLYTNEGKIIISASDTSGFPMTFYSKGSTDVKGSSYTCTQSATLLKGTYNFSISCKATSSTTLYVAIVLAESSDVNKVSSSEYTPSEGETLIDNITVSPVNSSNRSLVLDVPKNNAEWRLYVKTVGSNYCQIQGVSITSYISSMDN